MKPIISLLMAGIMVSSLKAQPVNDDPCGAIPLTVETSCTVADMDNFEATNSWAVPSIPCASSAKDVWFSAIIPASGMLTIETFAGSIYDAVMAVYTGTCDAPVFAYCKDDYMDDPMPRLDLKGFIPGDTIYIRFFQKGGGAGTFGICAWDNSPPLEKNNDCFTSQLLCTQADFYGLSAGIGTYNDLNPVNSGCMEVGENASSWYVFTIGHPGTLSFSITPIGINDNYDFAIWGTAPSCPPATAPLRCSYAGSSGATGMDMGSNDLSEDTEGDGWVQYLDVDVGQTYVLMIDDHKGTAKGFHLEFTGQPVISCTPFTLPVTITAFTGYAHGVVNVLEWTAASQMGNAAFMIERAAGDTVFSEIGSIPGAGSTTNSTDYIFYDELPPAGIAYYRLALVDVDGSRSYSQILAVSRNEAKGVIAYPNPSFGTVRVMCPAVADKMYTIQVVNMCGELMLTQEAIATGEQLISELHISKPGIYNIVISDSMCFASTRVVIVE